MLSPMAVPGKVGHLLIGYYESVVTEIDLICLYLPLCEQARITILYD
jgi:hypothetical protein